MTLLWIILAAGCAGIILLEWALWKLFTRRIEGLHLHLSSTTGRQLFTLMRIRVCVIAHAIFLLCITIFPLYFLW